MFKCVEQAQQLTTHWLWLYNDERPNMAIGVVRPKQLLKAAQEILQKTAAGNGAIEMELSFAKFAVQFRFAVVQVHPALS